MMGERRGFTLVELTMVLVVAAIVMSAAIPMVGMMLESSKKAATLEEMLELKRGIVGEPGVTSGGDFVQVGFEGDIGSPPPDLQALAQRPAAVPSYNRFTRTGWNGPYIDPNNQDYLTDAWGVAYAYDRDARTITSVGSSETIALSF